MPAGGQGVDVTEGLLVEHACLSWCGRRALWEAGASWRRAGRAGVCRSACGGNLVGFPPTPAHLRPPGSTPSCCQGRPTWQTCLWLRPPLALRAAAPAAEGGRVRPWRGASASCIRLRAPSQQHGPGPGKFGWLGRCLCGGHGGVCRQAPARYLLHPASPGLRRRALRSTSVPGLPAPCSTGGAPPGGRGLSWAA